MEFTSTLFLMAMLIHEGINECLVDKRTEAHCFDHRYGRCINMGRKIIPPITFNCFSTTLEEINSEIGGFDVDTHITIKNTTFDTLNPKYNWKHVTKLDIDSSNITNIVPGFFSGLSNLRSLRIVDCNITDTFQFHLSSLALLEHIDLSNDELSTLEEHSIWVMHNLSTANFSKNRISSLPNNIFKYQEKLKNVDFSDNTLKQIDQIKNIETLESVNVSHNLLEVIQDNFTGISLAYLDLSFNNISNVSVNSFTKSRSLEVLDLSHNVLKTIPGATFMNLSKLKTINMNHNLLHDTDENFSSFSLIYLDLCFNNISTITVKSFTKSTSLEVLELGHNSLKLLPTGAFWTLGNLTRLNLSNNKLSSIQFGLFNGLKSLKYLDLSNNEISINIHTLTPLANLETLLIAENINKNLDVTFLVNHFKQIRYLSLDYANWSCSKLAVMIQQLQRQNISVANGQTHNSSNINGIECVEDFENNDFDYKIDKNISNVVPEDFYKTAFFKFFNKDFQNTGFFKLINQSRLDRNQRYNQTEEFSRDDFKILRNISTDLKEIVEKMKKSSEVDFNKTEFFKFLNQDFQSTGFFKFINQTINQNFSSNQRELYREEFDALRNISKNFKQTADEMHKNYIKVSSITPNSISSDKNISSNDTLLIFDRQHDEIHEKPYLDSHDAKLKENSDLLELILDVKDDIKSDIVGVKTITIIALLIAIICVCFMFYKNFFAINRSRNINEDVFLT